MEQPRFRQEQAAGKYSPLRPASTQVLGSHAFQLQFSKRPLSPPLVAGVNEVAFKVNRLGNRTEDLKLGIVPVDKLKMGSKANIGYFLYGFSGCYYELGSSTRVSFAEIRAGDTITVTVDLNANTIVFKKNRASIGSPQSIPRQAYYFSFAGYFSGDSVTIKETA